jgi:hypothetical protein
LQLTEGLPLAIMGELSRARHQLRRRFGNTITL